MVFHGHFYNAFLQFIEADWFPVVIGSPYTRTPPTHTHTHTHTHPHTHVLNAQVLHIKSCALVTQFRIPCTFTTIFFSKTTLVTIFLDDNRTVTTIFTKPYDKRKSLITVVLAYFFFHLLFLYFITMTAL